MNKIDLNEKLFGAAANGHLDTVKYLVSQGADIQAYNDSALRLAAKNGHYLILSYLFSQCKPDKQKALEWHTELNEIIKENNQAIQALPELASWLVRSS